MKKMPPSPHALLFRLITPELVRRLAADLLSRPTAPFKEEAVVAAVRDFAGARPWVNLSRDPDGNLHLARRGRHASASPIVFSAHMDHPGFVATGCKKSGKDFRVAAEFRGGVEDRYFPGAAVRFFPGGEKAHVLSVKKDPKTGHKTALLSSPSPVTAGGLGMWDLVPFRFDPGKNRLVSRVVDDLAGVTAALALFDALPRLDPGARHDVRAILTRGEEVGFWGAIGAARAGRIPRGATVISLEASKALSHAPLGGGPVLRVGDRASVFDDGVTRELAKTAQYLAKAFPLEFRWQRKLMDGGTCEGTAFQAYGYRTGALCVPLLNYHNMGGRGKIAAEAVNLSDLTQMARWMAAWALEEKAPVGEFRSRLEKMYSQEKSRSGT
jgi:putative aminopeptidase FrvX